MSATEQIPTRWDHDRDERFFRIVARLLPCDVVEAASSLLASYDEEPLPPVRVTVSGTPAELVPVRAARGSRS